MLAGRVLLNGRPAQPGDRYSSGDRVLIDGKDVTARLKASPAPRAIIYHKPQGEPIEPAAPDSAGARGVARPSAAGKSVLESLPALRGARWLAVNPMQPGDSGLLLLTSDGTLADALRRRTERTSAAYLVRVLVPFAQFDVTALPRSVQYDEEAIEFSHIEAVGGEGTNRWFRVESQRAHRRAAVRALFESRGLKVSRIIQVRLGALELPRDLPRGKHRALSESQLAELYAAADLPVPEDEQAAEREARKHRRLPPDRRRRAPPSGPRRPTGSRSSGR